MEKRNIVLIIIFTIILITVIGFLYITLGKTIDEEYNQNQKFINIDKLFIGDLVIYRYYDKDTKVIYMFTRNDYSEKGGGLTVMVDADGKPLLYEEKNKNE